MLLSILIYIFFFLQLNFQENQILVCYLIFYVAKPQKLVYGFYYIMRVQML